VFSLSLELRDALKFRDALKLDYDHPMSPYDKCSPVLLECAQGLKALPVPEKLILQEASSLMSIWKNENVLVGCKLFHLFIEIRWNWATCVSANYDEQLLAKYTESGGNPRDFVWKGMLSSFISLECPLPIVPELPPLFAPPPPATENRVTDKNASPGSGQRPWRTA
jgi:hypothetical protein